MALFCDHCGREGHEASRHGSVSPVVQGYPSAVCKTCKTEFHHAPMCPEGPRCPSCDEPAVDYDEGPIFHRGGCPLEEVCGGCGRFSCICDADGFEMEAD